MSDAELLKARTISSRHTVVIGGGLLGLEAARAMRRFNTKVTVIEQSAWLMFQQLDEEAGALLGSQIKNNGITVRTGVRVQSIKGSDRVESIVLTGNEVIDCDTVVMATGIQSNMELARDAKLNVRMGILVNDRMQTNDPNIYAVGECAEYQGKVYGLVKPCLEQAAVAASVITGGQARYAGSELVTQLKVIDSPVFSIGETSTEWNRREVIYRDNDRGLLRKLFLIGNRLDAALAIGGWPEFARLQEAVTKNRRVWPWQLARFAESGSLWPVDEEAGILSWPASATVCNCMGVTRGALSHEISKGCRDVRSLAEHTGASTVCGTCRPLLQQMIGIIGMEPVRASRLLSIAGGITLVAVLVLLVIPGMTYRDSVQSIWHWDILWRDNLFKQISGFSLLGLSTFLAFISLPKRIRSKFRWGDFSSWRAAHVVVGAGTLLVLLAHTGFRLGHELNMLLMLTFSSLLLAGGLLSASIGLQHRIPLALARTTRNWSLWAHVVLLWPLPALLGFHVLKTYWY
jgi:nitrite reductase (NADH) large subunit